MKWNDGGESMWKNICHCHHTHTHKQCTFIPTNYSHYSSSNELSFIVSVDSCGMSSVASGVIYAIAIEH